MEEENPFNPKPFKTDYCYPVAYSDNVDSEHYIDQFLCINDGSSENHEEQGLLQYPIQEIQTEKDPVILHQIGQIPTKSTFHNFQKHLALTLKKNIKINSKTFTNPTKGLQHKLWKSFKESSRTTRTLIFLITGSQINDSPQQHMITVKLYGMQKIFQKHPPQLIKQAQQNLKNEIIRQLQNMDIDGVLNKRRIRNKQSFKAYLQSFVSELKNGTFGRRIPKQLTLDFVEFENKLKIEQPLSGKIEE